MAIPFYDEITFRLKKENIVNSEDEDLKKIGLEPLIMYLTPLFIDPDGKLYCSSNSNHYETIINNHVKDALSFLNNDYANYVINKKLTYLVYEDNIYFMEDGAVREQGSHAALMAAGGGYAALFTAQKRLEEGYKELVGTPAEVRA